MIKILINDEKNNQETGCNNYIELFKYNKDLFTRNLSAIIKFEENISVSQKVLMFDNSFEETIKKFTKIKTIKEQNNVNKWFTNELRLIKRDKIIKYQIATRKKKTCLW